MWAGSTLFNLSLLSSDVFAIIAGIFLFQYTVPCWPLPDLALTLTLHSQPSVFYFVALVVIIVGLVCYNINLNVDARGMYQRLNVLVRGQPPPGDT